MKHARLSAPVTRELLFFIVVIVLSLVGFAWLYGWRLFFPVVR